MWLRSHRLWPPAGEKQRLPARENVQHKHGFANSDSRRLSQIKRI